MVDNAGGIIFANRLKGLPELRLETSLYSRQREVQKYRVLKAGQYYIVSLPLKSKFETVGRLELITPAVLIDRRITSGFIPVVIAAACLLFAYLEIGRAHV